MTISELSNEFDVYYDNLATKGSPGLDSYDKSVFLTKGQLEVVKDKFTPRGNKYNKGFEGNSKRRVDLNQLVLDYKTTTTVSSTGKMRDSSVLFKIPENTFLIVFEEVSIKDSEPTCLNGTILEVKPKTHDEFSTQLKNPFKNPDASTAWRLDKASEQGVKVVEILSEYTVDEYHMRYVMLPPPIILTDLDVAFPSEGLSIQGEVEQQNCTLDNSVHQEIVDRAVQLAMNYYKTGELKTTVQLNERNE